MFVSLKQIAINIALVIEMINNPQKGDNMKKKTMKKATKKTAKRVKATPKKKK